MMFLLFVGLAYSFLEFRLHQARCAGVNWHTVLMPDKLQPRVECTLKATVLVRLMQAESQRTKLQTLYQ